MTINMPEKYLNIRIGHMNENIPFDSIVWPLIREAIETMTGIDLGSNLIV